MHFKSLIPLLFYVAAIYFLITGFSMQGRIPQIMGLLLIIIGNQFVDLLYKSK